MSSEKKKKTETSPSKKEAVLQLRSYTFDEKQLKQTVIDNDMAITDKTELKQGRKNRTALNREVLKIKKVHTDNKRAINQFKKDVIDDDLKKCMKWMNLVKPTWEKLDHEIKMVEDQITAETIRKHNVARGIVNQLQELKTSTEKQCVAAITKMDEALKVYDDYDSSNWPAEFQDAGYDNQVLITENINQLKMDVALKAKKIKAGIAFEPIESDGSGKADPVLEDKPVGMTDTQLLTQLTTIGGNKGWECSIGFNGVSLFQNPSSTKSLRAAMEEAITNHHASVI